MRHLTDDDRKTAADWGPWGPFGQKNLLRDLERLADRLNEIPERALYAQRNELARADYEAWSAVEAVLKESDLSKAVEGANRLLSTLTFRLKVDLAPVGRVRLRVSPSGMATIGGSRKRMQPTALLVGAAGGDVRARAWTRAGRYLWEFFREPERYRRRLKSCAQCGRWFVDYARPNNSERCSRECTERWWNRERRKEARRSRHQQPKMRHAKRRV